MRSEIDYSLKYCHSNDYINFLGWIFLSLNHVHIQCTLIEYARLKKLRRQKINEPPQVTPEGPVNLEKLLYCYCFVPGDTSVIVCLSNAAISHYEQACALVDGLEDGYRCKSKAYLELVEYCHRQLLDNQTSGVFMLLFSS